MVNDMPYSCINDAINSKTIEQTKNYASNSPDIMSGNLFNILLECKSQSPHLFNSGRQWYDRANDDIRHIASVYGYSVQTVAAITAHLSPLNSWEQNLDDTVQVLREWNIGERRISVHFGRAMNKVYDVLESGTVDMEAFGQKTGPFYRNLCGDLIAVTVDSHAINAALLNVDAAKHMTTKRKRNVGDAYRMVTDTYNDFFGTELQPAEVQAIIWVYWKHIKDD